MRKLIGAICLIAGTAIGTGMLALPIVMASLGVIYGTVAMLAIWLVMYYTALVNIELNLQSGQALPLGQLGRKYCGPIAEWIGILSLKILTYSLLAVFIYGGTSIFQNLFLEIWGAQLNFELVAIIYAIGIFIAISLPVSGIDYVNRLLFSIFIAMLICLIVGLIFASTWEKMPISMVGHVFEISSWQKIIPVIFTSFGFQVIFHSLTDYCDYDKKLLKRAFFWGSLVPAIVYIIWTSCVITILFNESDEFFAQILYGNVEVGAMIAELSNISEWKSLKVFSWWITILAIVTSAVGVGLGLTQSWNEMLRKKSSLGQFSHKLLSNLISLVPPLLVTLIIPNAFIAALSFAGMILVIIAILLPIYLLYKLPNANFNYSILRYNSLNILAVLSGFFIIYCEVLNVLF